MKVGDAFFFDTVLDEEDGLMRDIAFFIEAIDRVFAIRAHDRSDRDLDIHFHRNGNIMFESAFRALRVNALDERPGDEIAHDNLHKTVKKRKGTKANTFTP